MVPDYLKFQTRNTQHPAVVQQPSAIKDKVNSRRKFTLQTKQETYSICKTSPCPTPPYGTTFNLTPPTTRQLNMHQFQPQYNSRTKD
jgi:hypothetical protein